MSSIPFAGFHPEALLLLAENRLQNSTAFYNAHKEELKQKITVPMRQIFEALSDDFAKIDPSMHLISHRVVSRIRRDTRFSKEKSLYRSNIWFMAMRPKSDDMPPSPCFWFELNPDASEWNAGVAVFANPPRFMAFLRGEIAAKSDAFLDALESAQSCGAIAQIDSFKRDRAGDCPDAVRPFLNAKNFFVMYASNDFGILQSPKLIKKLRGIFAAFAPLYQFYAQTVLDWLSKEQNDQCK
ncbi:MAG: DUF2461 domain-containing protein [Oscillospiraceae bacterium]|jgi:uncharacterized protein (DUF2461 family)|nr:DUF2461 domain-containing protein [Oscillospiraceae bacterium]